MNPLPAYQIIFLLFLPFSIVWYLYGKNLQKRGLPLEEIKYRNINFAFFFISFFSILQLMKGENLIFHITDAIIYALIGIFLISKRKAALYLFPISIILKFIISSLTYGYFNIDLQTISYSARDLLLFLFIFRKDRKLLK